jgi:hypothetical protein
MDLEELHLELHLARGRCVTGEIVFEEEESKDK